MTEQASPELLAQPVFDSSANVFEKISDASFDEAKHTAAAGADKSSECPVLVDTAKVGEDANKGSDSGRVTTEAASTDKPEQAVAVDGVDTAKSQVRENNATVEKDAGPDSCTLEMKRSYSEVAENQATVADPKVECGVL